MEDLHTKLASMEAKLDIVHQSVEKMRRYFQILLFVTIAMVVLPIIGLAFAIPVFLNMYSSLMSGLL